MTSDEDVTRRDATAEFDPNGPSRAGCGIFGLPQDEEQAGVIVLGVPFEATTSYGRGTARGPQAVRAASEQIDLFDLQTGHPYRAGIHMRALDPQLVALNEEACALARPILETGGDVAGDARLEEGLARVNALCGEMQDRVTAAVGEVLAADKLPALVGGDHSVAFGSIRACAERHHGLGILHFDAHADLREAYEGFTWSHASVLFNVVELLDVERVVQVGIRDLCEEEHRRITRSRGRIETITDRGWSRARLAGEDLLARIARAVDLLPRNVYVTFDVDGLDPSLCPHTGTPVPGGLSWNEAMAWLEGLARSGRRVVGVDVNEVNPGPPRAPGERDSIDAIVGARLLYRLIGTALQTRD